MPGRNPKTPEAIAADPRRGHRTRVLREAREESTPKISSAVLRVPGWLDDTAKKEWRRIIKLARKAEIFSDLDLGALGMYCQAYSRLQKAYTVYNQLQEKIGSNNTALITKDGKINPLIDLMRKEEEQCRKWGSILGLDPVGRARIGVARAKSDKRDPLEDLINDVTAYMNQGGE